MTSRLSLDQRAAVEREVYLNYTETNQLLNELKRKKRIKKVAGSTSYTQTYQAARSTTAKSIGSYADLSNAVEKNDRVTATWTPGALYDNEITDQMEKEKNTGTNGLIRNMRKTAIENVMASFYLTLEERLWDGTGASFGSGGTGSDVLGITQAISATPTTGTYAGINRATFSDWRNVLVDGNAGVNSAFASDVFDRLNHAKTQATRKPQKGWQSKPDMLFCTKLNKPVIQNEFYEQNTYLPAKANTDAMPIEFGLGMRFMEDENVGASLVYLLNSSTSATTFVCTTSCVA